MLRPAVLAAAIAASAVPAAAADMLDPAAPCGTALSKGGEIADIAASLWALGYTDATNGRAAVISEEAMNRMSEALRSACAAAPETPVVDLVRAMTASPEAGVETEARALLGRFLDPAADRSAMTLALKPSPADIRAVYGDPLAGRLIAAYDGLFVPGAAIGPKPGQTELLLTLATTGALKRGDPVLAEFPGGYEKVRDFFVGDVPIVRFKFVEPGAVLGMAFDGLIQVNGRWVLMPKPWSALD